MSVLPVSLRNPNSPSEVSGHVVHERSDNENVEIQKLDKASLIEQRHCFSYFPLLSAN